MTYSDLKGKAKADYADLDEISKAYPLEWTGPVIRFKQNCAVAWLIDNASLNSLGRAYSIGNWPLEDMMQVYRMMGYSLCGFQEIFAQKIEKEKQAGRK
jgi:hypothetical protein